MNPRAAVTKVAAFAIVAITATIAGACSDTERREGERVSTASEAVTQCVNGGATLEGVDVYDGQGAIDWNAAKAAGITFAIIKATQGTYNTQTRFATSWANAKTAGVYRSAYHFFDPTEDGVLQANHFLQVMGPLAQGDLPPMLDIECPDGSPSCLGGAGSGAAPAAAIRKRMIDWLSTVEAATGKKPIIYTFGSYFSSNGVDTSGLSAYPLFIAYPTAASCFDVPSPWTRAVMWQYSWKGVVPGISGQVDRDRFIGKLSDLQTLAQAPGTGPGAALAPHVNGNDTFTAVTWPDGHADVFGVTTKREALHVTSQGVSETWNASAVLSSGATCGAASLMWKDGHVELFDPTSSGGAQNLWWSKNAYNAFQDFGGAGKGLSHASTVTFPDGHPDVFALGADHAIWRNKWNVASAKWEGWTSLGGNVVTGAAPMVWLDGHVEIYATDANGQAWHSSTIASGWSPWASLGGALATRPVPVRWPDGRVELFARGADDRLQHASFTNGAWEPFTVLDANVRIAGEPHAIVVGAAGAPEIYAREHTGLAVQMTWTGAAYSPWVPLGNNVASDVFAWTRGAGVVDVFALESNGDLVHTSRQGATAWAAWDTLASGLDPCASAPLLADAGVDGAKQVDPPHSDAPAPDVSVCLCAIGPGAASSSLASRSRSAAASTLALLALIALLSRRARVRRADSTC